MLPLCALPLSFYTVTYYRFSSYFHLLSIACCHNGLSLLPVRSITCALSTGSFGDTRGGSPVVAPPMLLSLAFLVVSPVAVSLLSPLLSPVAALVAAQAVFLHIS